MTEMGAGQVEVGMEGELTMRSASALRFSKGCSSLNLDRMVMVDAGEVRRGECGGLG
jgi:hypothetical protein